MESGLTHTPEQSAESRKQNLQRTRQVFGGRFHDGIEPSVEDVLAAESARLGVTLAIKKEGSE
jgi:hypothetical protein